MKSTLKALFAPALILPMAFVACHEEDKVEVSGVKLNTTYNTISLGENFTLKANIHPENADNKNVQWQCDETYLHNNGSGNFIGMRAGVTTVYVITSDGGFKDSCKVIITELPLENPSQNIDIKDEKLRELLVNDRTINIDGDEGISRSEATLVKSLDISGQGISSFDELNNFFFLEELNCSNNAINSLDVSKLKNLKVLRCSNTQLTQLNISQNLELTTLVCNKNNIDTLDIRNNKKLEDLFCGSQTNTLNLELTVNQFNTIWEKNGSDADKINVKILMNIFENASIKTDVLANPLKDGGSMSVNPTNTHFNFNILDSEGKELSFFDKTILQKIVWTSSDERVIAIHSQEGQEGNMNTLSLSAWIKAYGTSIIKGTFNDEYSISFTVNVE